ncbi:MAG TPA: hypothetical protein DCP91_04510 [Eggerthellaceae bacterium]|nr:hypothetical protein [Eggerthellaceae bacterium]
MKINHAILHVFDFTACENTFAREEIDISDKTAKNYVSRHVNKALGNLDNKRGAFADDSRFAEELRAYFAGQVGFVELSVEIGEFLARELGHMEKPVSTDVLVVDFEESADAAAGMADDPEAAFDGPVPRFFGIFLLESKQAYVHELGFGEAGERNGIARHHAVLPSPSQKIPSCAIVDLRTLSVMFSDKKRTIAGEEIWLIPDGLLQCSMQASTKETFAAVTEIVEAVAEEYGQNATVALSRAKAYAVENAVEDGFDDLDLHEMAEVAFEGDSAMSDRFEKAAEAIDLPERVPLEREAVRRVARNHKIRTDTGIEVTFPAEYSRNPEYITFTSEADGTISIQLKNIGSIENR